MGEENWQTVMVLGAGRGVCGAAALAVDRVGGVEPGGEPVGGL